jgi:hypothetical protein
LTCFLFSSVGHLLLKCHALSRNQIALIKLPLFFLSRLFYLLHWRKLC